jgi:hypothetical protein
LHVIGFACAVTAQEAVMFRLRRPARITAYAIAVLLSAVWTASALASLRQPLFDLAKPRVGDAIIAFAGVLAVPPENILKLAHLLVGLKLLLGAYLLAAVISAVYERLRYGASGDEMLDLGLFLSAVASIIAASPVFEGEALQRLIGELMLCAIASGLASYGRGFRVPRLSLPRPISFADYSPIRFMR